MNIKAWSRSQQVAGLTTLAIDKPFTLWINDGLMMFFFLLTALKLKREILEGQLSTPLAIATPGFRSARPHGDARVERRRPGGWLSYPYIYLDRYSHEVA